jgi:hypothetical protein
MRYHLASGASAKSGASNFTYQVAYASAPETGQTTNLNAVTWAINHIQPEAEVGHSPKQEYELSKPDPVDTER